MLTQRKWQADRHILLLIITAARDRPLPDSPVCQKPQVASRKCSECTAVICGCIHFVSTSARIAGQTSARACLLYAASFGCLLQAWRHCLKSHTAVFSGFIDMHVHMTGGGGEAGPASRSPEAQVKQLSTMWQHSTCHLYGTVLCHLSP